jgi:hypothetical protein
MVITPFSLTAIQCCFLGIIVVPQKKDLYRAVKGLRHAEIPGLGLDGRGKPSATATRSRAVSKSILAVPATRCR